MFWCGQGTICSACQDCTLVYDLLYRSAQTLCVKFACQHRGCKLDMACRCIPSVQRDTQLQVCHMSGLWVQTCTSVRVTRLLLFVIGVMPVWYLSAVWDSSVAYGSRKQLSKPLADDHDDQ
jgi:hypothetical protein